jgi:hypothetical protein
MFANKIEYIMKPKIVIAWILFFWSVTSFAQNQESFDVFKRNHSEDLSYSKLQQFLIDKENQEKEIELELSDNRNTLKAIANDSGYLRMSLTLLREFISHNKNKEIKYMDLPNDLKNVVNYYYSITYGNLSAQEIPSATKISLNAIQSKLEQRLSSIDVLLTQVEKNKKRINELNMDIVYARRERENKYQIDDFNKLIVVIFAYILAGLLVGFYVLLIWKSHEPVAKDFLAGSGLQFMALFALIICIAMFGVKGIIDGKELATMLSAIAGFILGKSYPEKKQPPKTDFIPVPMQPDKAVADFTLQIDNQYDFTDVVVNMNGKPIGQALNGFLKATGLQPGKWQMEIIAKTKAEPYTIVSKLMECDLAEGQNTLRLSI